MRRCFELTAVTAVARVIGIVTFGVAIAVSATLSACSYHVRQVPGASGNQTPTAVIHNAIDGQLKVAADVAVIVSASDSSDADGDALTYIWTVDAACAPSQPADLTSVDLHLSALVAGTECAIAVTVTDPFGASDTANATLIVSNVGAHVASTGCLSAYNDSSDTPQGTKDHPFCALQTGVDVAHIFQIAEVPVATDGQTLNANLVLSDRVTIRGGYDRNAWTLIPGAHTTVLLAGPSTIDPSLHIQAPGVSVTIDGLALVRTKGCIDTCAVVDVVSTNVTLTNLDIGSADAPVPNAVLRGASGRVYYSVRVVGPTATSAAPTTFAASSLSITGASGSDASTSIEIDDAVTATLGAITINEPGSRLVAGLHTARTAGVSIDSSVIAVAADGNAASVAYGVYDGNAVTGFISDCPGQLGTTCNSSQSLGVTGCHISINNTGTGIGIAAFGTGALNISATPTANGNPVNVGVLAQRALSIFTMQVAAPRQTTPAGFTMSSVTAIASAVVNDGGSPSFSYGWSDGIDGDPTNDGIDNRGVFAGSQGPQVSGNSFTAQAAAGVGDVAGVLLRGTNAAALAADVITAGGSNTSPSILSRAAGLRLMKTTGTTVSGCNLKVSGIAATWAIGNLMDGQLLVDNSAVDTSSNGNFASTNLAVTGSTLTGDLDAYHQSSITAYPVRSCIHLYASTNTTVDGNALTCHLVNDTATEPTTAGIVTITTQDVAVTDNVINISTTVNDPAIRIVGLQDGSRQDLSLGSARLSVERNIISLDAPGSEAIGIRLTGAPTSNPPASDMALVDDNFISAAESLHNAGILVQTTSAIVAFNSVRGPTCLVNCSTVFATGIYAMHLSSGNHLSILANTFSAPYVYYGADTAIPAIVEHDTVVGTIAIDTIVDNVYGWETDIESPVLLVILPAADVNVDSPRGMTAYDEAAINGNAGTQKAIGNLAMSPIYCPDGRHGDPSGPQKGAAVDIGATQLSPDASKVVTIADIDKTPRTLPSDSGADVITTCP